MSEPSKLSEAPVKEATPAPTLPSRAPSEAPAAAPTPARATSEAPTSPSIPKPAAVKEATPAPESAPAEIPPTEEIIDMDVFEQILDLDEEGEHDFSSGMVSAYFAQASSAFEEMDSAYTNSNLTKLKELGHFLKGSSAALGIYKVQAGCEHIQHFGDRRDETANRDLTSEEALDRIKPMLASVKSEYAIAERWLRDWYEDKGGIPDLPED